ncbi:MAG: hypothetical protein ACI8UX_001868, partial [Psychromonas sp.]
MFDTEQMFVMVYSLLRLFTGSIAAALAALKLMVINAMTEESAKAIRKR